jgi:predicted enzyme related to lactoylglutathione lyase
MPSKVEIIKTEDAEIEEEEIPEIGSLDLNRTVVLKKYSDEVSAEMAKQVLSEEGISAIISKDDTGGMTPNLFSAKRIRLLVLNKDLENAKKILNIGDEKKIFDNFNSDMFLGLRTAVYHVDNLEKGKEWYSRALEINPYFNKPFYAGFDIGGFELGLNPDAAGIAIKNGGHVAYWGVSNIEAVFKHLLLIGAQRHEDIKEVGRGILVASVVDPFGNIIGLIQNPHFEGK